MKLSDLVLNDWQRKLAALIFGLSIWWWVRLELQQELILRSLPVELVAPQNVKMEIMSETPRVDVFFKGSRRRLAALSQKDVEIIVQVPEVSEGGEVNVQISADNVKVPLGIRVSEVRVQDPKDLIVTIEEVVSVDLPIRYRFSDSLPPEFGFKQVVPVPAIATVTGPRSTVETLKEVVTESIEIGPDPPMQFDREAGLTRAPRVKVVPERIKVQVELQKESDDRVFTKIPVHILAPKDSEMVVTGFVRPEVGEVEVVVQGPNATVDSLTNASLRAFVDLSDIGTAGTYRKSAQVWVNARNCRVLETLPASFEIKVERRRQE
jgi:hypothetical protein